MFKNRSMQVKFVKEPKNPGQETETTIECDPNEVVDHVSDKAVELGTLAVKGTIVLIATYFAADTIRQVIIKSTPLR